MTGIVDAHHHVWRLDRCDYDWLSPEIEILHRDYLAADIRELTQAVGADRTILVQAAETEDETRYLLDVARSHPFIAGVVGWADLEAPDIGARLARLKEAGKGLLKGIRPVMQDMPDPSWMLRDTLGPAFDAMIVLELRFDALIRPVHLKPLRTLCLRYPALRVIVDHAAKPAIAARDPELRRAWSEAMRRLAADTRAFCKLSGLATEARPNWTAADLEPYVDVLLEAFGPQRLAWGSDWPVLNLAGDYASWYRTARELVSGVSEAERAAIFGGTATAFYSLQAPKPE